VIAPVRIIPAHGEQPPHEAIAAGVEALREGDIVGVPTDTVYGLAADAWHSGAADRLFRVKGRPRNVELPVLVSDADQAMGLVTGVPDAALRLMKAFWPGALTLVLPRAPEVTADLGDEDATIGIRCPAHPVPIALCREFGPIATTSANRHGAPPLTRAAEFAESLSGVAVVLDAGECNGAPSTVVDATGETPRLLREGAIPWEQVQSVVLA
jgi:tRNA threonylcarbamoyl adenosine modification protein (Sua5/YciO/YrdC/YwlC family)